MKTIILLFLLLPVAARALLTDKRSFNHEQAPELRLDTLPYLPRQFDLIIDELLPRPSPASGLPDDEFVELKNNCPFPVNLSRWSLSSPSSTAILPDYTLQPDSFVTVCSAAALAAYMALGPAVGVRRLPSLNNEEGELVLRDPSGSVIHALHYTVAWYHDAGKAKGGYSLEMINTLQPCEGSDNWIASTAVKGGTPGHKNAADDPATTGTFPDLLQAYPADASIVQLVFSKTLDSITAADPGNYSIDNGVGSPLSAVPADPLFQQVTLTLPQPLQEGKIYTVTTRGIRDCEGHTPGIHDAVNTGLPLPAGDSDAVINEILYHPKPGGSEFVEIYNRSNKILSLQDLHIARRDKDGNIISNRPLSEVPYLFFPHTYIVLTKNKAGVTAQYYCKHPEAVMEVAGFPALPDEGGTILLLKAGGEILDEIPYHDSYHSAWISNTAGVSLERRDYDAPGRSAGNWHSAAAAVGYATPTYQNSQFMREDPGNDISVAPKVISPDQDGIDDQAVITYHNQADAVVTLTVFDAAGRPVRNLAKNALLGATGRFVWDGRGNNGRLLPAGIYVLYAEIVTTRGKVKHFTGSIAIAAKLR